MLATEQKKIVRKLSGHAFYIGYFTGLLVILIIGLAYEMATRGLSNSKVVEHAES